MQMPRIRMTVPRLMIAIAVTVSLLPVAAGIVWRQLPEQVRRRALIRDYQARAEYHAERQREFTGLSKFSGEGRMYFIREGGLVHMPTGQRPELVPKYQKLAKYHGALRQKHEYAR